MPQKKIVTVVLAELTDGLQIYRYLLSDGPYHDPALAAIVSRGTALPVLDMRSYNASEKVFYPTQAGATGISIGSLTIKNADGRFDSWMRYNVAGMRWVVKRLYEGQAWEDGFLEVDGKAEGRPSFTRDHKIRITLGSKFGYMREPVATEVFDENTENQALINTTVPVVFGEVYQVEPKLAKPSILAYVIAANLAQTYAVAEGGNTQTPQYVTLPQGFQLQAASTLTLTADAAGPPAQDPDVLPDALGGAGQFEDWDSGGELQYPGLAVSSSVNASLSEGANSSTGVFDVQASNSFDTGFQSGTAETVSNQEIRAGALGLSLPEGAFVTGIEVEATARWQQVRGVTIASENVMFLGFITPEGFAFGGQPSPSALDETFDNYSVGGEGDLLGADLSVLTADDLNSPDFKIRITASVLSNQQLVVSALRIKIYYVEEQQYVRMMWANVIEAGERYTLSVETLGADSPEDSVVGDWSASVDDQNPQSARRAEFGGARTHEYVFTAGGRDFDMFFYRGNGNGVQEINSIILRKGTSAQSRYADLIRYLHESAGQNPDDVCDNASLALVQAQADNPRLGWFVDDQATREEVAVVLSRSLGAVSWGGLDGKWRASQMRIPKQPESGTWFEAVNRTTNASLSPDYGDGLTDRVHAARNGRPLTDAEVAGVTSNWTRTQIEQVKAPYRVTERADFNSLIDYDYGSAALSVDSIDPDSGGEAGGTSVTIYGSGFSVGATVTFGGSASTLVVVVDANTITCETPAGGVGSVDVVVAVDGDSATLAGGFEYEAAGAWTPASLFNGSNSGVWYDFSDTDTLFQDAAGTTPATSNGDPIGNVTDSSGSSGIDLTPYNDDTGLRGELDSSSYFLPVCYFDGSARMVADLIFGGDDAASVGSTVGMVLDIFDTTQQRRPFIFGDDISQQVISYGSDNTLRFNNGSLPISGSAPAGLFSLVVRKTGADSYDVWVNGVQQVSGGSHSLTQSVADYLTLGFGASNLYSTVAVGEFFAVNEAAGPSDITGAIDYFSAKWGL